MIYKSRLIQVSERIDLQDPDMGKMFPCESTGLAGAINSAGRYGVRTHPVAQKEDDIFRFLRVPAIQERLCQFFVSQVVPMSAVCAKSDGAFNRLPYLTRMIPRKHGNRLRE